MQRQGVRKWDCSSTIYNTTGTFKRHVLQASCIDNHKPGRPRRAESSKAIILDGLGLTAITSRREHR